MLHRFLLILCLLLTDVAIRAVEAMPDTPPPGTAANAGGDAPAPPAPVIAAPPLTDKWTLQNDRNFSAEPLPNLLKATRFYSVDFEDDNNSNNGHRGILLAAATGRQHFLRITERAPHAIRWELKLEMSWEGGFDRGWQFTEHGFYVSAGEFRKPGEDHVTTEDPPYDMIVERDGDELKYYVNNELKKTLKVPADDRTTIQAASERFGYLVVSAKLYFKKGEALSDPPKAPVTAKVQEPKWKNAFEDDFAAAESLKKYFKSGSGELVWNEKYHGMLLKNTTEGGDVYAAVHKALPGDIRIKFRALRRKDADQVSIGVMFGLDGALKKMDGYFAEFAEGTVRLKKQGHLETKTEAPTPVTQDRWVHLELSKVGAHIEMRSEDKKVLSWDDPHPLTGAAHDLLSFYVWSEQTIIADLVIERNENDPTQALTDDPALEDNAVNSRRGVDAAGRPKSDF